jgi:hypothetical protein
MFKHTIKHLTRAAAASALILAACVEDNPVESNQPPPNPELVLVHYWHFNTLPEGTISDAVPADFSLLTGANISYPGTGGGYADRIDGSDINARNSAVAGFAFRARNPANTRQVLIVAPSTGYKDLVVKYAAVRTANGAQEEELQYSANGGTTWTKVGQTVTIGLDYALYTFDLSAITAVNNNPGLQFRILQVGDAAAGTSGNNRFDNITVEGVAISETPAAQPELVHYWHFNDLPSGTLADPVAADFSKLTGANITYPGTGAGFADRVDPGSDLNAQMGAAIGYGYRARNPANTRELIITAPSTGYRDIKVSYAATRTSSGAQTEEFYYSVDGSTWVQSGSAITLEQDVYAVYTFDLSAIAAVNNNPALRFRILQTGAAAAGASGNNRFDNIAIFGTPIS